MHTSPVLCTALWDRTGCFPLNTFSRCTTFAETFSYLTCALHFFRLADCHLTFPCTSLPPSSSPVRLFPRPFFDAFSIFSISNLPLPALISRPPLGPSIRLTPPSRLLDLSSQPARGSAVSDSIKPLLFSSRHRPKRAESLLGSFYSSFISFPFISNSWSTLFSVLPLPFYSLCELRKIQLLKCDDPEI